MYKEELDGSSLERIVPELLRDGEATGAETLRLHVERYKFASENLVPGSVLDIACGVGYGTAILSANPAVIRAVGVDVDPAAIAYASERYSTSGVSFFCSGALEFNPHVRFENIVSLETIEHVTEPYRVFEHLVSLLVPKGRLIASVPVTPSVDANPHHQTDFSEHRFRQMGNIHSLACVSSLSQVQHFNPIVVLAGKEARSTAIRRNLPLFYFRHPTHLASRLWSTIRHGFVNRYLTIVWQRPN